MRYETPRIRNLSLEDVLSALGPARALIYASASGGGAGGTGHGDDGPDCL